jgi:hypothetical protein
MPVATPLLTTTCDIYRPFGAGSPTTSSVSCRLVACLPKGRATSSASGHLIWSHYIDVADTVDVRDGCTRAAGANAPTYADGDEVRIPGGGGTATRYVVVWVELVNRGTSLAYKRAYLLRDTAAWPGP